jgi:hypothetical protein
MGGFSVQSKDEIAKMARQVAARLERGKWIVLPSSALRDEWGDDGSPELCWDSHELLCGPENIKVILYFTTTRIYAYGHWKWRGLDCDPDERYHRKSRYVSPPAASKLPRLYTSVGMQWIETGRGEREPLDWDPNVLAKRIEVDLLPSFRKLLWRAWERALRQKQELSDTDSK